MNNHILRLAFISCFGILLLSARIWFTQSIQYAFLIWNLILAWVPLGLTMYIIRKSNLNVFALFGIKGMWLLFLPNAPYLITDLKHLKLSELNYSWVDPLIFFVFSFIGVYLALFSSYLIQKVVAERTNLFVSWCVIILSFLLSGFGVYLGRIERYNSWDIFTHPFLVLKNSLVCVLNFQAQMMTLTFAVFMVLAYFLFIHSSEIFIRNEKKSN